MKCPKCKTSNPENKKFCRECGAALIRICPECGEQILSDDNFCGECCCDLRKNDIFPPIDFEKPQSYTPRHLVDKILTVRSAIEGERKLVSVLFADVANYTTLAEKLDPEEVHQIMDGCFRILIEEIHKYEGTINQFTGDGVMALFGAPVAHEDHAQRACYAALSIQKGLEAYGYKIQRDTGSEFKMRIGINSGHVIVGSIGDDLRMDYTAVGDITNLASRMESIAQPGTITVSRNTHRLVNDYFELKSLGNINVKGKEKPQEVFELTKTGKVATRIKASILKGLTRFVGRKNSMAAVMEVYEKVKSGSGQVLALVGDAGVGKSRLLLEMNNRLLKDNINFMEGRCIHYGGYMAYYPILEILRTYFNFDEDDRDFIRKKKIKEKIDGLDPKLNSVVPPFHELLSLSVDDDAFYTLEPKEKRRKTFEAIRDLLIRISEEKPLILAIEDLHWMDKNSEEFIDYFIGWLAASPILLILLYRPEYTHTWGSKSYYTQVGLDQLGSASSTELVNAILDQKEIAPELKNLVLNRTAGNPLFMEEFVQTLLEKGYIRLKGNKYALVRKPYDIQVPDTVQGIILARMDRLEETIKHTMQVASVIGRDFAYRILQTITGLREDLNSYLLILQNMEFIYEKKLFPELEYIFKHAITQEVAYNSLLQNRRKEIHQKIGNAIEQIYGDKLEEFYEMLAYHYSRGDNQDKAFKYLILSGDKATNNFANNEAFGYFKEALEVLNKMPKTVENKKKKIDMLIKMCLPMEYLGFPEGSLEILKDAEEAAREIGDERSLVRIYSKLGNYYSVMGSNLEAVKIATRGFEEAKKIGDMDIIMPIGIELMISAFQYGDYVKAMDIAYKLIYAIEKAHKEADIFGRSFNVYANIHGFCGVALAILGEFKKGEAMAIKGLGFAKKLKHLPTMALADFLLAYLYAAKADGLKAKKYGELAIRYCMESGIDVILPLSIMCLGFGHFLREEYKEAQTFIQRALQVQKKTGMWMGISHIYACLAMLDIEYGNYASAQNNAQLALDAAIQKTENRAEGCAWLLLGRIMGKKLSPDYSEAKENITKGIMVLDEIKARPYLSLGYYYKGDLYRDMKEEKEAFKYLKLAEDNFIEMEMDYYLIKTQELLGTL